jgi:hypothetical protein
MPKTAVRPVKGKRLEWAMSDNLFSEPEGSAGPAMGEIGDGVVGQLSSAGYKVVPKDANNPPAKPAGETLGEILTKIPGAIFNPGRVGGQFK